MAGRTSSDTGDAIRRAGRRGSESGNHRGINPRRGRSAEREIIARDEMSDDFSSGEG